MPGVDQALKRRAILGARIGSFEIPNTHGREGRVELTIEPAGAWGQPDI